MKELDKWDIQQRLDILERQYVIFSILSIMSDSGFTVTEIDYNRQNEFTQAQLFVFNGKVNGNEFRIYLDKITEDGNVKYDFAVYSYDAKFKNVMEDAGSLFHYTVQETDLSICNIERIIETLFKRLEEWN